MLRLIEVRGLLEAEVERVKTQLNRHTKDETKSIWKMRKDELVEEAKKVLGWSHAKAQEQTAPQLQMFIRKHLNENKPKKLLPTGINRMPKTDLQHECLERDLSVQEN